MLRFFVDYVKVKEYLVFVIEIEIGGKKSGRLYYVNLGIVFIFFVKLLGVNLVNGVKR